MSTFPFAYISMLLPIYKPIFVRTNTFTCAAGTSNTARKPSKYESTYEIFTISKTQKWVL